MCSSDLDPDERMRLLGLYPKRGQISEFNARIAQELEASMAAEDRAIAAEAEVTRLKEQVVRLREALTTAEKELDFVVMDDGCPGCLTDEALQVVRSALQKETEPRDA